MKKVTLGMGKPVEIAQAPPEIQGWGPFQFPEMERLPDGTLRVLFHIKADSATAYGQEKGQAFSDDGGKTFRRGENDPGGAGITLPNGDRLRACRLPSLPVSGFALPAPLYTLPNYGAVDELYAAADFPEQGGWPLERLPAGESVWQRENVFVEIPGELRVVTEGVVTCRGFWRLRLAPDGAVWAIGYGYFGEPAAKPRIEPIFCRSADNGKTFRLMGRVPYMPYPADPQSENRSGYTEPDIAFLPDGSLFCLLRTTDGNGIGPLFSARSTDGGESWSKPKRFDDLGVWPILETLPNGVTLAAYGRPGLFLRACADAEGKIWEERQVIVPPGEYQTETCSYAAVARLDENSIYFVYSDFNYKDSENRRVKAILGRKITADLEE